MTNSTSTSTAGVKEIATNDLALLPSVFATGEIIELYIGPKRKKYSIHKELAVAKSPYFATSLKDCWNGQTNQVELPDADPSAFETFINWAYKAILSPWPTDVSVEEEIKAITSIYKLADKFMVEEMHNAILDKVVLQQKMDAMTYDFQSLQYYREAGVVGTQLYRMVLDDSIGFFMQNPTDFEGGEEDLEDISDNPELVREVFKGIREYNKAPWPLFLDMDVPVCKYHAHSNGTKCVTEFW